MYMWIGGLIFSFIFLAAVVSWSLIYAKGRVLFKTTVIGLVVGYALILCLSIPKLQGWPTDEPFPESGAYLLAYQVIEPGTSKTVEPGIYLWVVPKISIGQSTFGELFLRLQMEPRAYRLPYREPEHKQLIETSQKRAQTGGLIFLEKKGKEKKSEFTGQDSYADDQLKYKFISPYDLLKKDSGD